MTETIKLQGTEKKLYQLVAPLVMNPDVLRYNNGYPFKTGETFVWFLAVEKRKVIGFIPVERRKSEHIINNYYAAPKAHDETLALLLEAVLADEAEEDAPLTAVAQVKHQQLFAEKGFKLVKTWRLYIKMQKDS